MSSAYRITPVALYDLESIAKYLRTRASEDVAALVIGRILARCEELVAIQALGHKRKDLTSKEVLFESVGRYLVVFTRDTRGVTIHSVLHSARDVAAALRKRSF